jgi:hypothetical protein
MATLKTNDFESLLTSKEILTKANGTIL